MYQDAEYFEFLDGLAEGAGMNASLAAFYLAEHFPGLRAEEAKAICIDWRTAYHGGRVARSV